MNSSCCLKVNFSFTASAVLRVSCVLTSLIFICSCSDSPTGPGGGKIDVSFPNAVGMLWKYQVYDSLSQTTDTVWFSITDTLTVSPDEFFTKRSEKLFASNFFRSQYLRFSGDTLEIFSDTSGASANERIVFPLELGSGWTGPAAFDDTSTVTLVGQIDVPAARFRNGARIDRSWFIDFEGGGNRSQTWVAPDVGMVYQYNRSQFSDGQNITVTKNEVWELIDYDLTTFGLHQFPNNVGDQWVYAEIDSGFTVEFDTVTITIVDSGQFESGDSYTLWEFVSSNGTDTQYVVIGEERLRSQRDTTFSPIWDLYYDFPLAVGRNWGVVSILPIPRVIDKESILTPIQHFPSAFHTRMSGGAFNDYWTQEDWLAPGVGIVRSRRSEIFFAPTTIRTWTLIDYHLAN